MYQSVLPVMDIQNMGLPVHTQRHEAYVHAHATCSTVQYRCDQLLYILYTYSAGRPTVHVHGLCGRESSTGQGQKVESPTKSPLYNKEMQRNTNVVIYVSEI